MTSSRPHRTQIKSMELVLLPAFINVVCRVIVECTHGADEPCGGDAVAARRGGLIVLVPACAHTDARHRLTVGRIREYRHPLPSLNNPQLDVELVDLIGPSERAFIARASRSADSPTSVRYREDDRWRSTGPQHYANRHCDFVCCVWCVARPAIVRYGSRHRLVPPAGVAWCPNMEMPDSPPQKVLPCGLFSNARASAKRIQGLGGCRCAFLSPKYRDIVMRRSGGRARTA
ncbi:hypothetical protein B0H14DRAFT_100009 [Mycena olivaceomarginata]|nr:hypothetical protein B0H14DRAFT_100009 [Mycena olivaceomarginata]